MRRKLLLALFAVPLPGALWVLWKWADHHGALLNRADYTLYLATARLALDEGWHHLYDLEAQRRVWQQFPGLRFWPNVYTPALTVFVLPFTQLSLDFGYALWCTLLLAGLLLAWWLIAGGDWPARLAQLPLALVTWPVVSGLWLGQVLALQIGVFALACHALRQGRERTAGALLAVVVLKPQGMLLVPLALLAAGQKRLFTTWAACVALIGAATLALIGFDGALAYLHRLDYAQSHLAEYVVPWTVSLGRRFEGVQLRLIELGAVAAVLVAAIRHRDQPEVAMAAGLVGSLVASPYLHLEDFMLLVPAGWLLLRAAPGPATAAVLLLGVGAMAASVDDRVGGRWILLYVCLLLPALAALPPRRPSGANP